MVGLGLRAQSCCFLLSQPSLDGELWLARSVVLFLFSFIRSLPQYPCLCCINIPSPFNTSERPSHTPPNITQHKPRQAVTLVGRSTHASLPLVVLTKLHFCVDTFKSLCAVSIPDPDNHYACQAPNRTPAQLFVIPLSTDFFGSLSVHTLSWVQWQTKTENKVVYLCLVRC